MPKNPIRYVDHILEAIANIYTDLDGKDMESFCADRRTRQHC